MPLGCVIKCEFFREVQKPSSVVLKNKTLPLCLEESVCVCVRMCAHACTCSVFKNFSRSVIRPERSHAGNVGDAEGLAPELTRSKKPQGYP